MTYCPVCEGPCELDELRAELKTNPFNLVDADQLLAHRVRLRKLIARVERKHAAVVSGGQA